MNKQMNALVEVSNIGKVVSLRRMTLYQMTSSVLMIDTSY